MTKQENDISPKDTAQAAPLQPYTPSSPLGRYQLFSPPLRLESPPGLSPFSHSSSSPAVSYSTSSPSPSSSQSYCSSDRSYVELIAFSPSPQRSFSDSPMSAGGGPGYGSGSGQSAATALDWGQQLLSPLGQVPCSPAPTTGQYKVRTTEDVCRQLLIRKIFYSSTCTARCGQ
jgi:hypothetical protein